MSHGNSIFGYLIIKYSTSMMNDDYSINTQLTESQNQSVFKYHLINNIISQFWEPIFGDRFDIFPKLVAGSDI